MAISRLTQGTGQATNNPNTTINSTGAEIIVVMVHRGGSTPAVSTVTDSQGNTYTELEAVSSGATAAKLFVCTNPTNSASLTITGNTTGGTFEGQIIAACYDGVDATTPYYNNNSAAGDSLAFTPTGAGDAIISCGVNSSSSIGAYGTDQVQVGKTSFFGFEETTFTEELAAGASADTQLHTSAGFIFGLILKESTGGGVTLSPEDCLHSHTAESPVLNAPGAPTPQIKIESFDVTLTTATSGTISITDVGDVSKAFIRLLGCSRHDSAGPIGSTSNQNYSNTSFLIWISATNTISWSKTSTAQLKIMFEVWRYVGDPGGDYEFITRHREEITASGVTQATGVISGVTNFSKVIPFHNGTEYVTGVTSYNHLCAALYMNTSGQAVFRRNLTGSTIIRRVEVVEFTGSAWKVGTALSNAIDLMGTTGLDVNLRDSSDPFVGSIVDITDWGTAMIIQTTMGGDSVENGLADTLLLSEPAAATTQVHFSFADASARNDSYACAHVLQADNLVVDRGSSDNHPEGNNTYGTPISMPVGVDTNTSIDELSLEWSTSSTGTGTAHSRGALVARIVDNSGYEIQNWVHRSGNNVFVRYGVVDLSGLTAGGGGGSVVLAPEDCLHGHTSDEPSLQQNSTLSPEDGTHAHTADQPSLVQSNILAPEDGLHSHTAEEPNLTVSVTLSVEGGLHTHTAEEPILVQSNVIAPENGLHSHLADEPNLIQANTLNPEDGLHNHFADEPTLSVSVTLAPEDGFHGHTSGEPTLVQANTLSPEDCVHPHTSSEPGLIQSNTLAPESGFHDHSADEPSLIQGSVLNPEDGFHSHTSGEPSLIQANVISPEDGLHNHTADEPELNQGNAIYPYDGLHLHTAGEPDLVQKHILAPESCVHYHYSSEPSLTQKSTIQVEDCVHAHSAEEPNLVSGLVLIVEDGFHAHTSGQPNLVQANVLSVEDGLHLHTSEEPLLIQQNTLVVDGCIHYHEAGEPLLEQANILAPEDCFHNHFADEPRLIGDVPIAGWNNTSAIFIKLKNNTDRNKISKWNNT